MNRLFGSAKPKGPKVTLEDAITKSESRGDTIEKKVDRLNNELKVLNDQMKKAKSVGAKNALKQKAMRVLQQKKIYENRLDQTRQQVFNMEQMNYTQQSVKDAITTTDAMRSGVREMKQNMKKVNIDTIEDLHDDMDDMMEMSNEVQELFSRTYNMPEIDETELEAEFEALGDDMLQEDSSFLDEAVTAPAAPNAALKGNSAQHNKASQNPQLDEFGLPTFE